MYAHLVRSSSSLASHARIRACRRGAKFALEHQCAGIVRFEHGWNTSDRPIAYDFGINMAFATRADLVRGPHPVHQEVGRAARSPTGLFAIIRLPIEESHRTKHAPSGPRA